VVHSDTARNFDKNPISGNPGFDHSVNDREFDRIVRTVEDSA